MYKVRYIGKVDIDMAYSICLAVRADNRTRPT